MRNVVILGMHRSGTSMVAEALASAGLYVGEPEDLLSGQEDNPHGFWEREDVVALNDAILLDNGGHWYRPPRGTLTVSPEQTAAITSIVSGMPVDQSWLVKDPRQVLTWPLWERALADAVLVFVYRDPVAVAASLQRRNEFPLSLGLCLWEYYNLLAVGALQGRDTICVSYEEVAADPTGTLSGLLQRLAEQGVSCKRELDAAIFDASLGHARAASDPGAQSLLSASQERLASYCEALCANIALPSLPTMGADLGPRLDDLGAALAPLATVLETRIQLDEMSLLCDERTGERDESLAQFRQLESEHRALAGAHKEEVSLHGNLQGQHATLTEEHGRLQSEYDTVKYFASASSRSLLEFELSSLAGIWRFIAACYKLVTLRRGYHTSYDDALADSRALLRRFDMPVPRRPPGKLALFGGRPVRAKSKSRSSEAGARPAAFPRER